MSTAIRMTRYLLALLFAISWPAGSPAHADEITTKVKGQNVLHAGTVKFQNDELLILENEVGAWERIPKKEITEQVEKPAPPFVAPDEFAQRLLGLKADDPLIRVRATPECIAVLVLEKPVEKDSSQRIDALLTRTVKSYGQATKAVEAFAKKYKLTQRKPVYPAVVRLFESNSQASDVSGAESELEGGRNQLSSDGWYDPISNVASFSLPAILAVDGTVSEVLIWQQLFHTGMLKREAPIPWWFLLGVSTGFETSPTRLEANHLKLSATTFEGLQEPTKVDWDKLMCDYDFYFDQVEVEYYTFRDQSWGLHWYLIGKNKAAYTRYWKRMSDLTPLDKFDADQSKADFKAAFGKTPQAFKPLFEKAFAAAARTSPPPMPQEEAFWYEKEDFGQAKMLWIDEAVDTTEIRMDGVLTNMSPLRARSFCVGFVTNRGKSAVWFVDKLEPLKSADLKPQRAVDAAGKAAAKVPPEGEHLVDNVWIKSADVDSPEAEKWRKGELPSNSDDK